MPQTRRERQRAATIEEIKDTARQHMVQKGASAISMRAIAREMGMTAPALYRYYESRDELVTALIVDAYHALARALEEALAEIPTSNHTERIRMAGRAYRDWALGSPQEYSLIFGTPIPGYAAPMEITGPAAGKSLAVLIQVLDTAYQDGVLPVDELSPELMELVDPWMGKFEYQGPPAVIHLTLACWAQIHGLVSLELNQHLTPMPGWYGNQAFFETEIEAMIDRMRLRRTHE